MTMRSALHEGPGGQRTRGASAAVLVEVLSERSHGLIQDYVRIAQLAGETARRFDLPEDEVASIELAARLHDIGIVALPDALLHKPGPLNMQEWTLMRSHTEIGARIIGADPALADVAALVRSHHERYDGRGYPDGLAGEEIPLGACIIAVCDSFVAMMRKRSYIDAITVVEAVAELHRCAGSQFRPDVVEVFEEAFHELFA
ncbi:MAG TPA: HD domain-containing phosphohydrolase [Solirubrobacteraceae bacterium]|nr:HD domain-containing phosphohydrolase [Solirubrobacteraceae bacterium]